MMKITGESKSGKIKKFSIRSEHQGSCICVIDKHTILSLVLLKLMRFSAKTSLMAKTVNHRKLFRISLQVTTLLLLRFSN